MEEHGMLSGDLSGIVLVAMVGLSGCGLGVQPVMERTPDAVPTAIDPVAAQDFEHSHVVKVTSQYYMDGPQQGRPPDGEFATGTKVRLLQSAGSYSLVLSEEGTEAYVSSDVLRD